MISHRLAPLFAALSVAGCGPGARCCATPDCVGGDGALVGTDVLQFRGQVPTNLLFLSIDTLRKDHVGFHGAGESLTPFLDTVASEGVVLGDHAQCSNWTFGATTCTLAGRTNAERGHIPMFDGPDGPRQPVPEGTPLLAGWLADAGLSTALFTTNSWFAERRGNTQGYAREQLDETATADDAMLSVARTTRRHSRRGRDPWFAHAHAIEPHLPYDAPEEFRTSDPGHPPWRDPLDVQRQPYYDRLWPSLDEAEREQLEAHTRALYEAEVRAVDHRIEEAWTELDADCMLDDTLVVLWTDHGEAFWERGALAHSRFLTAEETDGVLLFWAKNLVAGVWEGATSAVDLAPTLLDLYGLPIPRELTGVPAGSAAPDRPIFADTYTFEGPMQSVIRDGWKLQYMWRQGDIRLWHRASDPAELELRKDPAVLEELWSVLEPQTELMHEALPGTFRAEPRLP